MHEYQKRLLAAMPNIRALGAGLSETTVQHDDHCGVFRSSTCDCDPDITIRHDGRSYEILKDGTLRPVN